MSEVNIGGRRHSRIQASAVASFRWRQADKQEQRGEALTRDLSTHGMYLYTEQALPPLGAAIELDVVFPPVRGVITSMGFTLIGRVVRVQVAAEKRGSASETRGFAIAIDRVLLRSLGERKANRREKYVPEREPVLALSGNSA